MEMQVWIPCACWFGSEPHWCWSPAPAWLQASLQHYNKSSFSFAPVVSRLLCILSQSMEVSRTFIRKTTKFHSNVTLHKSGLKLLLFSYCGYEQTPSLRWFLIFMAVFEWEVFLKSGWVVALFFNLLNFFFYCCCMLCLQCDLRAAWVHFFSFC